MNMGRLEGEQFAIYTRQSRNMTLSGRIPGLCILKALILAHRQLGHHLPWASPQVSL
jgi:hypothetical protein